MGREEGVTEEKLLALATYESSDLFDDLERAVLDYTVGLTGSPAHVDDTLVAVLREALGEEGLVELTAAIAWENFRARFNRGFDVAAQGFSEGAVCPLPEQAPSPRADLAS